MTAVIYHGPPGSYKTFSVTQDVIIPALTEGRVVVTNIRGLTSLETIEEALGIELPDTAEILAINHNREGFHDMARFFHWAPKGALIVMDEGQRVYPTRIKSLQEFDYPGGKEEAEQALRPATLEDAFDQHRHHNWDIYITTTHIDKIHREIRNVCEYGYRHRDVTGFLPWWNNRWKEVKHDPSNKGTAATHAVGQPRVRKADKRIFNCYQSTATGIATESSEAKNVLKNPKLLAVFGLALFACFYSVTQVQAIFARDQIEDQTKTGSKVVQAKIDNGNSRLPDRVGTFENDKNANHVRRLVDQYKIEYLGYITLNKKSTGYFRLTDHESGDWFMTSDENFKHFNIRSDYNGCLVSLYDDESYHLVACANPALDSEPYNPLGIPASGAAMQARAAGMTSGL